MTVSGLDGVQLSADKRAILSSGLPVLTYKTKKACGQRISGGAGGGYFTTAGTYFCTYFLVF